MEDSVVGLLGRICRLEMEFIPLNRIELRNTLHPLICANDSCKQV